MITFGLLLERIKALRFYPALWTVKKSRAREIIEYEQAQWLRFNHINETGYRGFLILMSKFPEFRSLVYHRTNAHWLRHFASGQSNLYFHTPAKKIGKGLVIWHGYSTVINAESIGENCMVWHNVTIGKKSIAPVNDRPIIGNNVKISTGSIVLGDINIADGATIAAGSTVIESCETPNALITGVKASEKRKQ